MRNTYFSVNECNNEEIEELQERVYFDNDLCDILSEEDKERVNSADLPSDIPIDIIHKIFTGIDFVDEDFFVNC